MWTFVAMLVFCLVGNLAGGSLLTETVLWMTGWHLFQLVDVWGGVDNLVFPAWGVLLGAKSVWHHEWAAWTFVAWTLYGLWDRYHSYLQPEYDWGERGFQRMLAGVAYAWALFVGIGRLSGGDLTWEITASALCGALTTLLITVDYALFSGACVAVHAWSLWLLLAVVYHWHGGAALAWSALFAQACMGHFLGKHGIV